MRGGMSKQLSAMQERFVEEYLVSLNATQAAIRAGYSERTAVKQGSQLLAKPLVAAAIQAAKEKRSQRTEVTADRVIEEFARVGFASLGDFITISDGVPVIDFSKAESNPSLLAAVAEITQDSYLEGNGEDAKLVKKTRFKLHDKIGALTQLAKHLGINPDSLNVKAQGKFEIRIVRADSNA